MLVYFLCWYWWYLPSQLQSPSNLHAELAAPKQSSMKKRVLVKQFICTISCIVLNVWALAYVKSHKTFQNWKTREDWFGIKGKNNEETSFWWGWWEEPLSHQWNLFCQQEQLVDSRQPLSFIFALNPLGNLCHSKFTFHIACILIFGTPLIEPRCSQIEDEKMFF